MAVSNSSAVDGLDEIAVHDCGEATNANPPRSVGSHGDDPYSKSINNLALALRVIS
jgi:hypothetical protein